MSTISGSYNLSEYKKFGELKLRTKRYRTSNLALEISIIIPRRSRIRQQRRREERVHFQDLQLKHFIRLPHDLPQPNRFLQLGLPLHSFLGGLGKQGVKTFQSTIVVDCTGV